MISKYTNLKLSTLLCFCVVFNLNAKQKEGEREHRQGKDSMQTEQLLCLILQTNQTEVESYKASEMYMQIQSFFQNTKVKKFAKKNNLASLRKLYRRTSKRFIQENKQFSFLPQIQKGKTYDCVSSALLYSFLLEDLGYNYSIYLTKTHTYLKIHLENKDVLLETTDPFYGLITHPKMIDKQIEAYKKESLTRMISEEDTAYALGKKIDLQRLVGVHFYNLFLHHYQNRNFESAAKAFRKAAFLHKESPEIKMFSKYFAKS